MYILSLISNSKFKVKLFANKKDIQIMKWYAHFFASYDPKRQKEQKALYLNKINTYLLSKDKYENEKGRLLNKLSRCPKVVFLRCLNKHYTLFEEIYTPESNPRKEKYHVTTINGHLAREIYNEFTLEYEVDEETTESYTEDELLKICINDNADFYKALEDYKLEKHLRTRI